MNLITLLINANEDVGHEYAYALRIAEAMRARGWTTRVAVPAAARIAALPDGWHKALLPPPTGASNWRSIWRFARSLHSYLRGALLPQQRNILFLETFALPHLIGLILALLHLPRRDMRVWLLYRFSFRSPRKALLYRGLNWVLGKLVGAQNVVLMTDSETMRDDLQPALRQPVRVIPVVPTPDEELRSREIGFLKEAQFLKGECLNCWWPGRPLPEKGLANIQRLASLTDCAAQMKLMVAQSTQIAQSDDTCAVQLLPNGLPRADYLALLNEVDVVLLPYDEAIYGKRTSGIFTEAISLGKLTVVTPNTWAAHELRRYGLGECVLDWHSPQLLCDIVRLAHDPTIAPRLAYMQADYRDFHCQHGFGQAFISVES
ncbi:MAG: hypothetical protein KIH69_020905 [Anaerolineae bacterium]|nr:hypothetical protein [Anaerolineae bacterium]